MLSLTKIHSITILVQVPQHNFEASSTEVLVQIYELACTLPTLLYVQLTCCLKCSNKNIYLILFTVGYLFFFIADINI